jgi:hypothetical protein
MPPIRRSAAGLLLVFAVLATAAYCCVRAEAAAAGAFCAAGSIAALASAWSARSRNGGLVLPTSRRQWPVGGEAAAAREADFLAELRADLEAPARELLHSARFARRANCGIGEHEALDDLAAVGEALLEDLATQWQLSDLRAARRPAAAAWFPVEAAVCKGVEGNARRARARRVALRVHVSRGVPVRIAGDRARLEQLIHALVGGLLHSLVGGALTVSVGCAASREGRTVLRFSARAKSVAARTPRLSNDESELCHRLATILGATLHLENQHFAEAYFDLPILSPASNPRPGDGLEAAI